MLFCYIELYMKNYKTLVEEIKEDLNKRRDIPCLWIGRLNRVKMSILPKFIYSFNAILVKISVRLFVATNKIIYVINRKKNLCRNTKELEWLK